MKTLKKMMQPALLCLCLGLLPVPALADFT
jgi:hypothetical protein